MQCFAKRVERMWKHTACKALEQSEAGRTESNLFPEKWIFLISISQKLIEKIKRKKTPQEIYTKRRLTKNFRFFGWLVCPLWRAKVLPFVQKAKINSDNYWITWELIRKSKKWETPQEVNIQGRLTKNFRLFRWLVCPLQCAKVSSAIFSRVRTLVVWPEHSV